MTDSVPTKPKLSIIVPVCDERESVRVLVPKVAEVLSGIAAKDPLFTYEMIIIDDGSTDGTRDVLRALAAEYSWVRAVVFRRNFGKSAAYAEGFRHARGELLMTIDGDLQDEPSEIPRMLAKLNEGYDLVSGWKKDRQDPLERRVMSRLFNTVVRKVSGVPLNDFNSGFKVYREWCLRSIQLSGNMYRFLPVLVARQGAKVGEIPVVHHRRQFGRSKFGVHRYVQGFLDLLTVVLLSRFYSQPMYFFALLGLPLLLIGGVVWVCLVFGHVLWLVTGDDALMLKGRPLLIMAMGLIGFGLNFLLVGALAEFVLQNCGTPRRRNFYAVEEMYGQDLDGE